MLSLILVYLSLQLLQRISIIFLYNSIDQEIQA